MSPEEMRQIVEQVTSAVAARPAAPTPPAVAMQPLSTMVMPPASHITIPQAAPIGVAVACTVGLPDGTEASCYLTLDPSALQNLPQVIAGLVAAGWPVRTFRPRPMNGWNNGGSYARRSWR